MNHKITVIVATLLLAGGCLGEKDYVWNKPIPDTTGDGRTADGNGGADTPATDVAADLLADVPSDLADTGQDVPCVPACEGKYCGPDGCGGLCGSCGNYGGCKDDEGTCVCEHEKCEGLCCAPDEVCSDGTCCTGSCEGKVCGDDGCGGSCGECADLQVCNGGGCECQFASCKEGELCCADGQICCNETCCIGSCELHECGYDGCCGTCGTCPDHYKCVEDAELGNGCEPKCDELCADKQCGKAGLSEECDCDELKGGCGDDNVCTDDSCAVGQCQNTANEAECNDGNPCTENDVCGDKMCAGTMKDEENLLDLGCVCKETEDCNDLDDANVCNGTLFCDIPDEQEQGICAIDKNTIPDCTDALDCTINTCDSIEGCQVELNHEYCADSNVCTTNLCSEELDCIIQNNDLACDDEEPCTTGDICQDGACQSGQPTVCADAYDCTINSCENGTGCVFTPDSLMCDDNNECTTETCSMDEGCVYAKLSDVACNDGDLCNENDTCEDGVCGAGADITCDDSNLCTDDTCEPDDGCIYTSNDNNSCVDDTVCNGTETCSNGQCLDGANEVCEDPFACTVDSCDSVDGCQYDPDDGQCDDTNPCTVDTCSPNAGCLYTPGNEGGDCDDGDGCTMNDVCDDTGMCTGVPDPACEFPSDIDHDGILNDADLCPLAFDPGNPDSNGIAGTDGCELLADHGEFTYTRPLMLSQQGAPSSWRRTHEPVEIPLANGIIDDSVVGYWKLDGGAAFDSSGNGHQGTVNGAVAGTGVYGDGDGGFVFDGDDSISIGDLSFGTNGSMCFRMALDGSQTARWGEVNSEGTFNTFVNAANGYWAVHLREGDVTELKATAVVNLGDENTWHHYCFTWNGPDATVTMWFDGQMMPVQYVSEDVTDMSGVVFEDWKIGALNNSGQVQQFLIGQADEVILFNRELAPDEIDTYYRSNTPYGTKYIPGAQADFDDVRVTEKTGSGDPEAGLETVKRARIIGPRPHSDTPCPMLENDGTWGDREDLCGVSAYWRLDGDGKDVLKEHNGINNGAVQAMGRFGDAGGALEFDGAEIITVTGLETDPSVLDQSLSVEAWLKWDGELAPGMDEVYLLGKAQTSGQSAFSLFISSTGSLTCKVATSQGSQFLETSIASHHWVHLAFTYDGADVRLYRNGLLQAQESISGNVLSSAFPFYLGQWEGLEDGLIGSLDEVIIHNVAKSADYIYHRANPGIPKVRFLANTVVLNQGTVEAPSYPLRDYTLHWGNADTNAHLPFVTSLVDAPGAVPDTCYGLLNGCHGYAGWWRFNEGRGDVAVDSSGWKWATEVGGTLGIGDSLEGVAGYFDGKTNFLRIADTDALDLAEFAVEALVFPEEWYAPGPTMIVRKGPSGDGEKPDINYGLQYNTPNGYDIFYEVNGGEDIIGYYGTTVEEMNEWYAPGGTRNAGKLSFHMNGEPSQDDADAPVPSGNPTDLFIGALDESGDLAFQGMLDSIRITNRGLEPDEFLHYPLVDWQMGEGSYDTACGGLVCPFLPDYDITCNQKDFCEYTRSVQGESWHQWDVWIYVPPGSFMMGGPAEEGGPADERPLHTVDIVTGYFISKYEVVVEQYEACSLASPGLCTAPSGADSGYAWGTNSSNNGRVDHPQNGLTWSQATNFCGWLIPDGRLPTEAEWKYAATGPNHQVYPWGDYPEPTCENELAVFNETGAIEDFGCGQGGTWPVGSKPAGAAWCGALDMGGNLWEWTEDWYHTSYSGAPADGSAWMDPAGTSRVTTGGAFDGVEVRTARREKATPSYKGATIGARCVRPMVNCIPACDGKQCGDDGCGGSCGVCVGLQDECLEGACICQPTCEGKECGDDGCGGICGSCNLAGDACVDGVCVCTPDCAGKVCGTDGCGGSCGECGDGELCSPAGECVECGVDGCPLVPVDGLVAYYPFNGDAKDYSGNQNHGIVHDVSMVPGRFDDEDGAYGFGEVGAYIEVPNSPSLEFSIGVTVSVWVKRDDVPFVDFENIVCKGFSSSWGELPFYLQYDPFASEWQFATQTTSTKFVEADYPKDHLTEWNHVVAVYDGVMHRIYVNNVLLGSKPLTGLLLDESTHKELLFGTLTKTVNDWYRGSLDDLAIYNRGLNETEITALYLAGCLPGCPGGFECGSDGCGGSCGECENGEVCSDFGFCITEGCEPSCDNKQCGDDGCGGQCGLCAENSVCMVDGTCYCIPDCTGKKCGGNGCGGSCGSCGAGETCVENKCDPCWGKACGDNGFGVDCGNCELNETCDGNQCVCAFVECSDGCCPEGYECGQDGNCCDMQCGEKVCGPNACGGTCGECPEQHICLANDSCMCIPDCTGKECGGNGCGGSCGECGDGETCWEQTCFEIECDDENDITWDGCADGKIVQFEVGAVTTSSVYGPKVATYTDGRFVVLWGFGGKGAEPGGLAAKIYSAVGVEQVSSVITDSPSSIISISDIEISFQGDIQMSIGAKNNGQNDIYVGSLKTDLTWKSMPVTINQPGLGTVHSSYLGRVANDEFLVTWRNSEAYEGVLYPIFARKLDADGIPVGDVFFLNSTTNTTVADITTCSNLQNSVLATWSGNAQEGNGLQIWTRKFDNNLTPSGSEALFTLDNYLNQKKDPVCFWINGTYKILWGSHWQDSLYIQEVDGAGHPKGNATYVAGQNQTAHYSPKVATIGATGYVVAWKGNTSKETDDNIRIYGRMFSADDVPDDEPFEVDSIMGGDQDDVDVATFEDGSMVFVWESTSPEGSGSVVYAQRFAADGTKKYK